MFYTVDTYPPLLFQKAWVPEGNMAVKSTREEVLSFQINKIVRPCPPFKTGHPRLALVSLNPAPADRDGQSGKALSDILQVVKGFSFDRKVRTVVGPIQS